MKKIISVFLAIAFVLSFATSASARLVGDVDSSGKVNSTDALMVLKRSVDASYSVNEKYADVNGDGKINSTDALTVLKISVGSYSGDLEVEDELVTSYKATVVDPIMATGKYTLTTEVENEELSAVATIMVNGKDICVDTVTDGVTLRVLVLDGKTYLVVPKPVGLPVSIYGEYEMDTPLNIGNAADAKYVKSEYVTVDGVEYVCETYEVSSGVFTEYYFKDGKWAMLGKENDGEMQLQKVVEFKKGVDTSKFSLSGMIKVDLSSLA